MTDLALMQGQFGGMCIGRVLRCFHPASFLNFEDFFFQSIILPAEYQPYIVLDGLCWGMSMKFYRKQTVLHILEAEATSQFGKLS